MPRFFCLIPTLTFLLWSGSVASQGAPSGEIPPVLLFPEANSRVTYFDVHNVRAAWEISRGAGVKVGILDHSFGYGTHENLYAGGKNFQDGEWGASFKDNVDPDSAEVLGRCKTEPSLAGAEVGSRYQFLRLGYFCVDPDSSDQELVFNRTITLRDTWAKLEQARQKHQR